MAYWESSGGIRVAWYSFGLLYKLYFLDTLSGCSVLVCMLQCHLLAWLSVFSIGKAHANIMSSWIHSPKKQIRKSFVLLIGQVFRNHFYL